MNAALALGDFGRWQRVTKFDQRARRIADRHYSRQSVGSPQFMPNGKTLVLLSDDGRAVWGVCENLPPNPPGAAPRWRCTIFRNEGAGLSSALIREATEKTLDYWTRHYGGAPHRVPLTTEIDPSKTRPKRDPGRCFRRAGWFLCAAYPPRNGLVVLVAPFERVRLNLCESTPF